ncbi:hypothetical protein TrST_g3995 [Triparma strigata]|uniref:Glycosyl transferase family 1 domain-containing protein n=1 Tax=Triparma strigata TaxID=1606541 RepID=A0A9W7EDE9_9STRA|nr:hypothetical protein TrST_g3995 [Triparma strigata]
MTSNGSKVHGNSTQRILIQTSCYCVIDGVTSTIRKLEAHLLSSNPDTQICILTTKSGDLSNLDNYLNLVPSHLHLTVHPRRTVIFVDALKLPVMDIYSYRLGLRLSPSSLQSIKAFNPTVIHSTVPDLLNLDLLSHSRHTQTPYVSTFHSDYILYMDYYEAKWIKIVLENYMRHTYSFTPELYVPTKYYKRLLSSPDYNLGGVTVIKDWPRPVDTCKFNPKHRSQHWRSSMGFKASDIVVCYCGRLVVEKNPDKYIEVMKALEKKGYGDKVKGIVIGDGPLLEVMRSSFDSNYVKCTGWLEPPELAVAYASSDLFLFPSGCETFGNVTLEACASGLPVIVEAGCSEHLVEDNGYAIEDQDDYYKRTVELIEDEGLRRRMAENSIILSKRFDLEIVCDKMAKIYEEAKPPKNDAPDNKFNFPWGRVEHPWVLIGIEVVFWILVTSCVQLTKLYEWSKRTPVINVAAAAVGNLLAIVLLGIGKLVPKAQAGGGKMSDRLGGMLALAILFPLSCKEVQRKVN